MTEGRGEPYTTEENLEDLRELWEADRDLAYLWQALIVARGRDRALPDWLIVALRKNLEATLAPPAWRRKQRVQADQRARMVDAVRAAIHGSRPYPYFYAADNEKASEAHFRVAAERLNAEGLVCNAGSVKKTWQRHKPLPYEEALALILVEDD
jgi:hypothetical protein